VFQKNSRILIDQWQLQAKRLYLLSPALWLVARHKSQRAAEKIGQPVLFSPKIMK